MHDGFGKSLGSSGSLFAGFTVLIHFITIFLSIA